jgi:hypothetical protein
MEMLVWEFLRAQVFDNWLFGLDDTECKCLQTIEDAISVFALEDVEDYQLAKPAESLSSPPPNADSKEKAQRWRTQTIAAMSRDKRFKQRCESRSAECHTELAGIVHSVLTEASARKIKSPLNTDHRLRTIFSKAADLAIYFRAQQGKFWRDENVVLGDPWDPVIMENAKKSESGQVIAVVVQGWLFVKGDEVKQRLCKTKVVVV